MQSKITNHTMGSLSTSLVDALGTKNKIIDIYDFSDVSPEMKTKKLSLQQVENLSCTEETVSYLVPFSEMNSTDMTSYKPLTNSGFVRNLSETTEFIESSVDFLDDDSRDKDFNINSLTSLSEADTSEDSNKNDSPEIKTQEKIVWQPESKQDKEKPVSYFTRNSKYWDLQKSNDNELVDSGTDFLNHNSKHMNFENNYDPERSEGDISECFGNSEVLNLESRENIKKNINNQPPSYKVRNK